MAAEITLYTPGGLFLDKYDNVDEESIWWPNDKKPYIRFRDPTTKLEIKTTLPFFVKAKPLGEYNGH